MQKINFPGFKGQRMSPDFWYLIYPKALIVETT